MATRIHEIIQSNISDINDNPSFSPVEDSGKSEINFDEPFIKPGFNDPFYKHYNLNPATTEFDIPTSTTEFNILVKETMVASSGNVTGKDNELGEFPVSKFID